MKTRNWTVWTTAVAGAAMAAALSMPALAQTAAHDHDATVPHTLALNQGHKWTNALVQQRLVSGACLSRFAPEGSGQKPKQRRVDLH